MWFDVEERYNTTYFPDFANLGELWFDVEERYNTTVNGQGNLYVMLWFDVEERYNTTRQKTDEPRKSCGLM